MYAHKCRGIPEYEERPASGKHNKKYDHIYMYICTYIEFDAPAFSLQCAVAGGRV